MDSTVISRRAALAGLAVAATAKGLTSSALAQRRILGGEEGATVSEANLRPRPIAVPPFISDDPKLGVDLAAIVANDLESSGLFIPLDQRSFIQRFESANETPRSADWRSIGAEALVVGQVRRGPDGRLEAEFRVWDTVLGKQLAGQRFRTIAQNWRRVGHIIADQAWEKLTLERGYFDTRIAFIDETGPKDKRIKRLAIMDQDGENVRLLSRGEDLVLTPRFSPVSQEIVYMAYAKTGRAENGRVVVFNIESGQREVVGDVPGTTYAPRFSPDGQRIVMSQSQGGASSLVELDLRSRSARRLTELTGQIVDTGACYAPDGAQLVFESDRSGNQQLYVMGADGAAPRRISNGDGRYSTPVWSPRGDYVAFTKQASGRFLIGVMKPDGSGERILTDGFHNEGPTWAPNGRFLMFFRESQGANGGPRLHSVDLTGRNERVVRTPSFASDPAWSPLLK